MQIVKTEPSVYLRRGEGDALDQRVRLFVEHFESFSGGSLVARLAGREIENPMEPSSEGVSILDAWIPETRDAGQLTIEIRSDGQSLGTHQEEWAAPRRWEVHVIQRSHHDVGYTDLASHVLPQHTQWLEEFLDVARKADAYPDEARARLAIEQAWSLEHFLKTASVENVEAMKNRIRAGDVEITALFGNMTTELCGHETLVRTLYAARRIAREIGVEVISAEHNDIPGMVWGLSEILIDAGVEFFCPAIALFYSWSGAGYPSFWDEKAIFGREGMPGAFWWESPSGRRLLLWCNNHGCNGERDPKLPNLVPQLQSFEENGYPWSLMRWPVNGGNRDNSSYIDFYTPIKEWNEKWAYPRLISSTNGRFYEAFKNLPLDDLPVHRGDMPGQDYALGAASTAAATAVNRSNHVETVRAEALASLAKGLTGWAYPGDTLRRAQEETIWHDEHTWGHHFPCGPTCLTSEHEKAVHAHRGAALAHDVVNKAMARIADRVRLDQEGIHLVVFNPSPYSRSSTVSAMLREIDNCGSTLIHIASEDPESGGFYKAALLGDRWHVNPDLDTVNGQFRLIDVDSGETVPYEISEISSPVEPVPYAGQRIGLSKGAPRYGFFEAPLGMRRDLRFLANNVPALGYRTYRLEPCDDPEVPLAEDIVVSLGAVENEFYRVTLDEGGGVGSIYDKSADRELIDQDHANAFGSLIVRDIDGKEYHSRAVGKASVSRDGLSVRVVVRQAVHGHPLIEQVLTLTSKSPCIEFGVGVLKDPTPNLEVAVAFPFDVEGGTYQIEEPLHVTDPAEDRLPGVFSNRLVPQDWVLVRNRLSGVLWSSLDAPSMSIGQYWPNRVSPAHCVAPAVTLHLPPQEPEELTGGTIYSCICYNNMMTNFSVNQSGHLYFRYVFRSCSTRAGIEEAQAFGDAAHRPFSAIMTKHPGVRTLGPAQAYLEIENPALRLITLKEAEDGDGMILRLWNPTDKSIETNIQLPSHAIASVEISNVVEGSTGEAIRSEGSSLAVSVGPDVVRTLRIHVEM